MNKFRWLARDKDGRLWVYVNRPSRNRYIPCVWLSAGCRFIKEKDDAYSFIKWENEPVPYPIGSEGQYNFVQPERYFV